MKLIESIKAWWIRKQSDMAKYPVFNSEIENRIKGLDLKYFEFLDNGYVTTDRETALLNLQYIPVKFQKWTEDHDCDNFAYEFFAITKRLFPKLAIGISHIKMADGRLHAVNILFYRTNKGRLTYEFIEPQTGKLCFPDWKPYFLIV